MALGTALDDGGSAATAPLAVRGDGSLRVDPPPLSLEAVRRAPEDSPARTLLELFFWAQWGSAPNIVAAYLPAVVRALGAEDLAGAYGAERASLLSSRPRIANTVRKRFGVVVTVELLRRNELPARHSFTLRRVGGRWRVAFDTLLEEGIAAYVQTRDTPAHAGAGAAAVPDAAEKAGIAAAREYRRIALAQLGLRPPAAP